MIATLINLALHAVLAGGILYLIVKVNGIYQHFKIKVV
jgi:hypothetical protein